MIKVEHLTKYYGDFLAVDDLSFEIDEGHVYGFLGPNGAGKSTTMNMMTGCLSATSGRVEVGGFDLFEDADQAKKLIGYLPEQPPLYMNETPAEYLRFVGEAKGLRGAELERQIQAVIEQVRIAEVKNRRISALSKGYKQRVGIAQALLELTLKRASLEDIFLELTENGDPADQTPAGETTEEQEGEGAWQPF